MPLETATYLTDLVTANPGHSDGLSQADSHMRLIKSTLKATFPNFTSAALNSTQANIDTAVVAANLMNTRSASVPAGAIMDFAMPTAPTGWLPCDGQAISRTTYADLFNAIGGTWGAGDGSTTFNVPPLIARYRRHRDFGLTAGIVGTLQNPTNLAHTHGVSGNTGTESADHTHTYSGTTAGMNANNPHNHTYTAPNSATSSMTVGGAFNITGSTAGTATSSTDISHGHTFSGTTSNDSVTHFHSFSVTSTGGSADNAVESRPYSASVLTCIKT